MNDGFSLSDLLASSTPTNCLASLPGERHVYASGELRWLCSPPGAVQSAIDLADPGRPVLANHIAMSLAAALPPRVARVLDLGTGCGALLRFVRARFPEAEARGVEQDPAMLEIARAYFALPQAEAVVVDSALQYLASAGPGWDLVFSDLFDGLREPDWLLNEDFCAALAAALSVDGAAALNLLPDSAPRLEAQLKTARRHFSGTALLRAGEQDNMVLVLSHAVLDRDRWEQRLRADCAFDSFAQALFDSMQIFD